MSVFSHSGNATARLFLMKGLFSDERSTLILTDSASDLVLLRTFANSIFPEQAREIASIGELLALEHHHEGIYFASLDIFRVSGNLYHIARSESLALARGDTIAPEEVIHRLITL